MLCALAGLGLYGAIRLAFEPRDPTSGVAVIFAPWISADEALIRSVTAGARFVRHGGYPFIAIVMPDDADYPARMRVAGAVMVADPRALAACLPWAGPKEAR